MTAEPDKRLDFSGTISSLATPETWEYERSKLPRLPDVARAAFHSLQQPLDFPSLDASIVPGDRVALAVDPNVPAITDVIDGVLKALAETEAGEIDVVVWDEANDATITHMQLHVGESIRVYRHSSSDRSSLRYLGADDRADPIYLNRRLVDADFVLPIVAGRTSSSQDFRDVTGVYPYLADAAARRRYVQRFGAIQELSKSEQSNVTEPAWLLGVQLMISVTANDDGEAGEVISGTPDAIRKHFDPLPRDPDNFPPSAPLVIASLDGDHQQQSWCNAAHALAAASHYVQPGGTIVLWSHIDTPPSGRLLGLFADSDDTDSHDTDSGARDLGDVDDGSSIGSEEDFPQWDETLAIARILRRIAAEHRLLIHSLLTEEEIESMGLGAIATEQELMRLSGSFEACGVLRAAQFAG